MPRNTLGAVRCKAHSSRTGKPCQQWAIHGATVCVTHGGSSPQVKQSAAERLAALVDPAITALNGLLAAESEQARLGAIKDVLDRNGFKPVDRVDLNARVSYSQLSDDDLDAQIAALQARTRAVSRSAGRTKASPVSD